ncbi:MAG: hypothetical protein JRI68_20685 [Deltaproteobacteria bacterium]|nr:hypothetical protein [Deltaproteobacteria bacterium]
MIRTSLACALIPFLALAGCSNDETTPVTTGTGGGGGMGGAGGTGAGELDVGEVTTEEGAGSDTVEIVIDTPTGTEQFIAMVLAAKTDIGSLYSYTAAATPTGTGQMSGDVHVEPKICITTLAAPLQPQPKAKPPKHRPWSAYQDDINQIRDARIKRGKPFTNPWENGGPPPDPPPNEGETRQFEIRDGNNVIQTIDAEAIKVTAELVIYMDRTTPGAGDIGQTDLDDIAARFGDVVLPRERIFFGQESDVNDDGHVSVLFSPLTYEHAVAYVSPWDLITDPNEQPPGVVTNNQELLYLTPPDVIPAPYNTPRAIVETMAHEFQHAIYFYRKYMLNDQFGEDENAYVTEGLSALAQDLTGYAAGNLYVTKHGLDSINDFSAARAIGGGLGYHDDLDGALRGGAYLFMRYLYDQAGGDTLDGSGEVTDTDHGAAWLRGFVDSVELGWENVEASTGRETRDVLADWYAAMMIDDRGPDGADLSTDPVYNYLPVAECPITNAPRGMSMFLPFHGQGMEGPPIQVLTEADGSLTAGGADYLSFGAAEAGQTTLTVTSEVAADLIVTVVRTE